MGQYRAGYHRIYYAPNAGSAGSATSLGESRKGITWDTMIHEVPIRSDRGGQMQVDGIQHGLDTRLSIQWIEYGLMKAAMKSITGGAAFDTLAPYAKVGHLMSSLAGPLYAVPVAGTPAAAECGADMCYIFYKAYPANRLGDLLSSELREGPLSFNTIPDEGFDDKVWNKIPTPGSFSDAP